MLTTIEQKLSAIKAINEEKENVEKQIERIEAQIIKVNGIVSVRATDMDESIVVPESVVAGVYNLMHSAYSARRQELIDQATELMK
jgi:propanediol dehydratase small subunit